METPITFLKEKQELDKMIKKLGPAALLAVQHFEAVLADEKADPKRRDTAAEKLISYYQEYTAQASSDNLQRLIAEVKINGMKNALPQQSAPKLDFSNIREV